MTTGLVIIVLDIGWLLLWPLDYVRAAFLSMPYLWPLAASVCSLCLTLLFYYSVWLRYCEKYVSGFWVSLWGDSIYLPLWNIDFVLLFLLFDNIWLLLLLFIWITAGWLLMLIISVKDWAPAGWEDSSDMLSKFAIGLSVFISFFLFCSE